MKVRVVKDHFCGTGWRAEPETLYLGGVGAVYVEKLEFVLPEEWDGLAVTLHIEQEGGTVPQPMLLDGNNTVPVDRRFTTARQGLWMLMATDGEGRREMTMPGKYVCYQTLENGEGTGADGPAMPLRYQYLQLVLEQEARAALEAQRAARYRQWVADRCAAKEHALLLKALSGMRYSDASAWDMIAQLKQRWNSPPPEQAEPVAVESIRLDSKELSIKVGESCTLKATVLPGSAPQTVEWMAEPEGIVQLRENTLTAVKGGTALLTAIAGGKLAQRRVQSVAVSLEKLALDKPSVKLKQGESVTLTATLTPAQSTVTAVSWSTSNAALAVMKDQTTAAENGKAVNTLAALKDGSLEGSTFADAKKLALALLAADAETAGSVPNTYFHFCFWTRTPVLNAYGSGLTGSALKEKRLCGRSGSTDLCKDRPDGRARIDRKLCRRTAAESTADADSCHHGSLLHCEIGGMDLWHGVPYRSAAV